MREGKRDNAKRHRLEDQKGKATTKKNETKQTNEEETKEEADAGGIDADLGGSLFDSFYVHIYVYRFITRRPDEWLNVTKTQTNPTDERVALERCDHKDGATEIREGRGRGQTRPAADDVTTGQ